MNPRGTEVSADEKHNRFNQIIQDAPAESFHEMTGKKGDVILMHPLMLHSASKNGRRAISTCKRHETTRAQAVADLITRNYHKPSRLTRSTFPVQPRRPG